MFISVFNNVCLKGCHPPEMQECWHEGRLVKLLTFCLPGRQFGHSFLWMFLLFPFTKWPNLWCDTCVIAYARRKRPPLVRGHHLSPASSSSKLMTSFINETLNFRRVKRKTGAFLAAKIWRSFCSSAKEELLQQCKSSS